MFWYKIIELYEEAHVALKVMRHILHKDSFPDENLRPVLKRDHSTLVHWYYYPDSYDLWAVDVETEFEVEDPQEPDDSWEVSKSFCIILYLQTSFIDYRWKL